MLVSASGLSDLFECLPVYITKAVRACLPNTSSSWAPRIHKDRCLKRVALTSCLSTFIMPSRLLPIVAVAHLLTVVPVIKAQVSEAKCFSGFDWVRHKTTSAVIDLPVFGQMNNSLHQTPCVVTAYAMAPCYQGSKIIISYTA